MAWLKNDVRNATNHHRLHTLGRVRPDVDIFRKVDVMEIRNSILHFISRKAVRYGLYDPRVNTPGWLMVLWAILKPIEYSYHKQSGIKKDYARGLYIINKRVIEFDQLKCFPTLEEYENRGLEARQ